jgi:ABC-type oligopeptide transport system substrate-binding subunit
VLKSILSSYVHQTTQLSMKTFVIKSFGALTLAAALLTSCEKSSGTSSYPKWEFDITIDGKQSHFKYKKPPTTGSSGAVAQVFQGTYTISLTGNSITDPQYVEGDACWVDISFQEKLGSQSATISTLMNQTTWGLIEGDITIDIQSLGTAATYIYNSSGGIDHIEYGKLVEFSIPSQTLIDKSGNTHTIEAAVKAFRFL